MILYWVPLQGANVKLLLYNEHITYHTLLVIILLPMLVKKAMLESNNFYN